MTGRLRTTLAACRKRGDKAMGLFLTNGFPHPDATLPILRAADAAGADFIELGMPFSDPLAEGLPIQHASERALRHGVTMADAFRTAERFRAESETPLLMMGYVNPVLRYGVGTFCRDAAAAGVDGLILPDLPPEEAGLVEREAGAAGLGLTLLVAPNTSDERVRQVDAQATAFVYAVSVAGLTGSDLDGLGGISAYLRRVRGLVHNNPLLVGFGIRTHADALALSEHTDGFIVGTALIRLAEALWDDASLTDAERLARVRRFARELKHGTTPLSA
ncbi:MAG: tryptophan synthase subunit alpha [Bacteroidota bacterium]